MSKKALLMILDGWGIGDQGKDDVIFNTPTPYWDSLLATYPHSQLQASGENVGLPDGQMPLQRRVPKFGFKNINRVEYKAINLDTIQKLAEAKKLESVGINDFIAAGFISSNQLVKVLGNGTLTTKLDVQAHAFSKTAVAAIEAAGGSVVKL